MNITITRDLDHEDFEYNELKEYAAAQGQTPEQFVAALVETAIRGKNLEET